MGVFVSPSVPQYSFPLCPLMGKFSNAVRVVRRSDDRGHGRHRNFGNRCTCLLVLSCSCYFLAGLLSSPCATLPWKTGWCGCAVTSISSLTVLAVPKGSLGGTELVTSGARHANRSPPLPLLTVRRCCHWMARAVESLRCRFLGLAQALVVSRKRVSGQSQCAQLGLA